MSWLCLAHFLQVCGTFDPLDDIRQFEFLLELLEQGIILQPLVEAHFENVFTSPVCVQDVIVPNQGDAFWERFEDLHPAVESLLRWFSTHEGLLGQLLDLVGNDGVNQDTEYAAECKLWAFSVKQVDSSFLHVKSEEDGICNGRC